MEEFEAIRSHLTRYTHQPRQGSHLGILEDLAHLRAQLRRDHPEEMRHLLRYCQGNALTLDHALQASYCHLHLSLPLLPLRS